MTNGVEINWGQTKKKFDALYNQAAVARGLEIGKATLCEILNGAYPYMNSPTAQKVIAKLDELRVLVRKPGSQEAA